MRWINKQRHQSTCGAVALANVLKKLNRPCTYKEALLRCGGLATFLDPKGHPRGIRTTKLNTILKRQHLDVTLCKMSLKAARDFAKVPGLAVIVCYAWKHKRKGIGGHYTALDEKGKALNNGRELNEKDWKITKKIWGHPPVVIVIKEK